MRGMLTLATWNVDGFRARGVEVEALLERVESDGGESHGTSDDAAVVATVTNERYPHAEAT
jgi:hypothetical protein